MGYGAIGEELSKGRSVVAIQFYCTTINRYVNSITQSLFVSLYTAALNNLHRLLLRRRYYYHEERCFVCHLRCQVESRIVCQEYQEVGEGH